MLSVLPNLLSTAPPRGDWQPEVASGGNKWSGDMAAHSQVCCMRSVASSSLAVRVDMRHSRARRLLHCAGRRCISPAITAWRPPGAAVVNAAYGRRQRLRDLRPTQRRDTGQLRVGLLQPCPRVPRVVRCSRRCSTEGRRRLTRSNGAAKPAACGLLHARAGRCAECCRPGGNPHGTWGSARVNYGAGRVACRWCSLAPTGRRHFPGISQRPPQRKSHPCEVAQVVDFAGVLWWRRGGSNS